MDKPLFSVCLITYNHIDYIREAIEGVLMQQVNFSWELIIADDCSTDGTQGILLEYKKKYPDFIRLILQEKNIGVMKNWMELLSAPQGKYISSFEGDDYWTDPLKLQKQVDFLEANPDFTMCFHNTLIKQEYKTTAKKEISFNGEMPNNVFELKDLADTMIAHTSSIVFVKSSIFPLPEWFKNCFTGDLVLILLLAGNGKLKYLDFFGSVYRQNDGGISSRYHGRFLIEGKIEMYQLINKHFNFKYTKVINPILGKYYYRIVPINIHAFEFKKAISNFYKALTLKPIGVFSDFPLLSTLKIQAVKLYSSVFKSKK